jgi:homoserine dehydrogenase
MNQIVGIIGRGTVGRALHEQINELSGYEVHKIAVRNKHLHRDLDPNLLAANAEEIVETSDAPIVLEAIDNTEDALKYAVGSLKRGKTYISASKKMIAENLGKLQYYEREYGGKLLYEAAVAGAIPVLRTLREHLRGERVSRVRGILNGSCNYILTRMATEELSFDEALEEAQILGFAESDPSSDVDGFDTYYKATILAYTLFGGTPDFKRVKMEGIRGVSLTDIKKAARDGEKIKLIADIQRIDDAFNIDIRPVLVNPSDPLYGIDRELNGVEIQGSRTGSLLLQGPGAGGDPTASAMVGDLLNAYNTDPQKIRNLLKVLV